MLSVYRAWRDALAEGLSAVMVTVLRSSGSTPRAAGAQMLCLPDGSAVGSVGGGAIEHHARQRARDCLSARRSIYEEHRLSENAVADLGMVCGGELALFYQHCPANPENLSTVSRCLDALGADGDSWLVLHFTAENDWRMALHLEGEAAPEGVSSALFGPRPSWEARSGEQFYVQPLGRAGNAYVFGGGHVGQALVPVLARLDFRCIVVDDRPEFLRADLFPDAWALQQLDFKALVPALALRPSDYACIMTRGHLHDYAVLRQLLKQPAKYIGLMGSRKKIANTWQRLREDGFSQQDIDRIYAPIGLPIGANSPEEIAVSIAAELIQVRGK